MRSRKLERDPKAELVFAKQLEAMHRGVEYACLSGEYLEERSKLFRVVSRYIDELNKVRKYACPLSTNMLLSSIMESLLLALALQHGSAASKTKMWAKVLSDKNRQGERINPEVPLFHLAELIQLIAELKLLRTSGVHKDVDNLLCDLIFERLDQEFDRSLIEDTWDAKRNHDLMHKLRSFRNAVHPLQILAEQRKNDGTEFTVSIWLGIRLLKLLNVLSGFESPLIQ